MNTIDRQYKELAEHVLRFGHKKPGKGDSVGNTSIFGWQITHDMKTGFPLLTTKKMAWKLIVTELLWFLRGDTNIKYLIDNDCHIWDGDAYKNYCKIITDDLKTWDVSPPPAAFPDYKEVFIEKIRTDDKFAKEWGELGPIYGKQWREWEQYKPGNPLVVVDKIDQIQNLIKDLKTNPDSRRLMVNAWSVAELDQMVLPPCHYGFQVWTRELSLEERVKLLEIEKINTTDADYYEHSYAQFKADDANIPTRAISLMWNQRSVDLFHGLPFNIASYALLLEILAKETNMVPETLIGNLGDVHIYDNHVEAVKEQISRIPYALPKLRINTEFWQTESGECGFGKFNTGLEGFEIGDFQIEDYQHHPSIKASFNSQV